MTKKNLEERTGKAILNIEKRITSIYNALSDLNLTMLHLIESKRDYYSVSENGYYQ